MLSCPLEVSEFWCIWPFTLNYFYTFTRCIRQGIWLNLKLCLKLMAVCRIYAPLIACSHRRHRQDKTVLSCLVRVSGVNTVGNKTRQFCLDLTQFPVWVLFCLDLVAMSFVLSRPSFHFAIVQSQIYLGLLKTWKLTTGLRPTRIVFTLPTWARQDQSWVSAAETCFCQTCGINQFKPD